MKVQQGWQVVAEQTMMELVKQVLLLYPQAARLELDWSIVFGTAAAASMSLQQFRKELQTRPGTRALLGVPVPNTCTRE